MSLALCTMFGTIATNPAQINLEAQTVQLENQVQNLKGQIGWNKQQISENLNEWIDYTKLPNYAPSEIEIVIPPNFDPKQLELEGEVSVEEVVEESLAVPVVESLAITPNNPQTLSDPLIKGMEISKLSPSPKTLKITQRQTVVMEKLAKADKIAKKFGIKIGSKNTVATMPTSSSKPNNPQTSSDPSKSGILHISKTDLKPLYESLYPSKQAINQLNKEILEEQLMEQQLEKEEKLEQTVSAIFGSLEVQADQWTSNTSGLLVYGRTFSSLAFGLDSFGSGTLIKLANKTNGKAKTWKTMPDNATIRLEADSNKCLDANKGVVLGSQITIWDCHGQPNQTWQTRSDGTIRPLNNGNLCITAVGGIKKNAVLTLQNCETKTARKNSTQGWVMGENSFSKSNIHTLELNTCKNCGYYLPLWKLKDRIGGGHAWATLRKNWVATNTFSLWSPTQFDTDSSNTNGSTNNIATKTSNILVDAKKDNGKADWYYSKDNCIDHDCMFRNIMIPKARYDTIRNMRGYLINENRAYDFDTWNCVDYALTLFTKYTTDRYKFDDYQTGTIVNTGAVTLSDPNKLYDLIRAKNIKDAKAGA